LGREGKTIKLRSNHFEITIPQGYICHYHISIQPDKCPRVVNRKIFETMVQANEKIFGNFIPVFDGRNNLFTRKPLPIGSGQLRFQVCFFNFFNVFKLKLFVF